MSTDNVTRLILPLAPSANVYYRHAPNRSKDPEKRRRMPVVTHISKEGRKFAKEVAALWKQSLQKPLSGRLAVVAAIWFTRSIGDVDNRIKPTLDALEKAGVFADDRQVERVEFFRAGIAAKTSIPEGRRTKRRKTERLGLMCVEIEPETFQHETVESYVSACGFDEAMLEEFVRRKEVGK